MTAELERGEEHEVETDGPEKSPDLLRKPGTSIPGMRRLNRVPLMIAAAVGASLVGVIGYTLIQKQERPQGAGAERERVSGVPQHASAQEILRDAPTTGVVKAAAPGGSRTPEKSGVPADLLDVQPARFEQGGRGQDEAPRAEPVLVGGPRPASAREQERERERQDRLLALREARAVPTAVQVEKQKDELPRGTGQVDPDKIVADLARARAAVQGGFAQAAATGAADVNNQAGKQGFLAGGSDQQDHYLHASRTGVVSPFEVKQGAVIPAVLIGGVNSDLPGQLIAQVSENVWDTRSGRYLLIPQGAKLIGTYDSNITVGQTRVLVAWTRIIFPDASSVDLGMMPGTDPGGYAGFYDKVNNHYAKLFGSALLLSVFSAGVQLSQPKPSAGDVYSSQQVVAGAMGQQLGQLGSEIARRNLQVQPTLEIRPGYRFAVMVTKDMVLEPWRESAWAQGGDR